MSAIAAALKHMLAAGMPHDAILAAVEEMEAALVVAPAKSAGALRTQRWRERKASQNVTKASPRDAEDERHKPSQTVTDASPRDGLAHVRDITSNSEIYPRSDVVVLARASDATDDWPEGDHLRLLVEAAESRRLDPTRQLRLHTSAGRIVAWRRDGASWAHDVLPIVTTISRQRGPPIQTWTYFDKAIAQSIADNRRALSIPEATDDRSHHNRPTTPREDRLGRMLGGLMAAVDERTTELD